MTASTDQGNKTSPASRRPRSKHAGWKSGLMAAGFGAVVLGAGYLAGTNAPAAGATSQTNGAQLNGTQPTAIERQQAPVQDNASQGRAALSGQTFRGDDESNSDGGFTFDDRSNSGSFNDNSGAANSGNSGSSSSDGSSTQQIQPRQFRRFRGNGSGLGQFGTQQPQFSAPVTRSRGS
jgi:hypothetical protein